MKTTRFVLLALFVALVFSLALPIVSAQEETPVVIDGTATLVASDPVVTLEPSPVVEPTVVPTQPPVNLPPDVVVTNGSQLLLYLLLAALGGGGLLTILYRFLERREARDLGEKLYEGASPQQQEILHEIIEGYRELSGRLLNYFDAITDGKPNDEAS